MPTRRVEILLMPDGGLRAEGFGDCSKTPELDLLKKLYGEPDSTTYKSEHYDAVQDGVVVKDGLPSGHCG